MYVCLLCVCVFEVFFVLNILMLSWLPWKQAAGSLHVINVYDCMNLCVCELPVAVEMHAAHGGRVSVQRVHALAALSVPHTQRPVGGAADHRGDQHLTAPHAAAVTRQRPQALRDRRRRRQRL